jgi:hypothetical protein
MKNSKNKRAMVMGIILLGLLVIAYKVIFMSGSTVDTIDTSVPTDASAGGSGDILNEIQSINFDTSILDDQSFKSFKSIEIPLISLPVGRSNPFSSVSTSK